MAPCQFLVQAKDGYRTRVILYAESREWLEQHIIWEWEFIVPIIGPVKHWWSARSWRYFATSFDPA